MTGDEEDDATIDRFQNRFQRLSRSQQSVLLRRIVGGLDANQLHDLYGKIGSILPLDPLSQLPLEIAQRVLLFMNPTSVMIIIRVCRFWCRLANEDLLLWQRLFDDRKLTSAAPWMKSLSTPKIVSQGAKDWVQNIVCNPMIPRHRQLNDPRALIRVYQKAFHHEHLLAHNWRRNLCRSMSIECHGNSVITCLQVDDDGRIITGSDDSTIKVWNGQTGKLLGTLIGHQGGVWALKAVGNLLVSGSTDRSLIVWDLGGMVRKWDLLGHTSTVRCLEIVGELVVSGSRDGTVRVWHWPSGRLVYLLQGHTASVRCLAVWRERWVVSGSYDQTCRVWDLMTGECAAVLQGHHNKVYAVSVSDRHVYSGSMDATVRAWNPLTGQCIFTISGYRSLVGTMQSRHGLMVSGSTDGSLRVWDTCRNISVYRMSGAHPSSITTLDFNHLVLASGSENMVRFWDISRESLPSLSSEDNSDQEPPPLLFTNVLGEDVDMVWRVVLTWRYCVAAYQSRGITRMEIMDFGAIQIEKIN